MVRRVVLASVLSTLAFAVAAPSASAQIQILDSNSSNKVDTITKGKCRVSGKKGNRDFFLAAKSDKGKFLLTVFIDAPVFTGFGDTYIVYYGSPDPQIFLHRNSDDEVFSNFKLPGTPAGVVGGGAVAFRKQGKRVGIGLSPAVSKGADEGYVFAGPINCSYRKKR